jgi:hypothetical protein
VVVGVGVGGWIVTGGAGRFQKAWRVDFWGFEGRGVGSGVGGAMVGTGEALRWAEKRRCIVFSELAC